MKLTYPGTSRNEEIIIAENRTNCCKEKAEYPNGYNCYDESPVLDLFLAHEVDECVDSDGKHPKS